MILLLPLLHLGTIGLILARIVTVLHLGNGAVVLAIIAAVIAVCTAIVGIIITVPGRGGCLVDADLGLVLGPAGLVLVVAGGRIRRPKVVAVVGIAGTVHVVVASIALVLGST